MTITPKGPDALHKAANTGLTTARETQEAHARSNEAILAALVSLGG